ncbi:MAG: hypothetical protein FWB74_07255 [Defluviitaleaceae bacterium]|nr:hypothetical protein [Defluviitaleaceae bacterium]
MATDREIKLLQHDRLFDLMEVSVAKSEEDMRKILKRQVARAEAAMTKEEIAVVKEKIESTK